MVETPTSKAPSTKAIAFSVIATLGLIWIMFFSGGEQPSLLLVIIEWLLLIGNLGFLIVAVVKRLK